MELGSLSLTDVAALVVLGLVALYAVVDGIAPIHGDLRIRPLFRL